MCMHRLFQFTFLVGVLTLSTWVVADPPIVWCTGDTLGEGSNCSLGSSSCQPTTDDWLEPWACVGEWIPLSNTFEMPLVAGSPENNAKAQTTTTVCCDKFSCVPEADDSWVGYCCVQGAKTGEITFFQNYADPAGCTKKAKETKEKGDDNPPPP